MKEFVLTENYLRTVFLFSPDKTQKKKKIAANNQLILVKYHREHHRPINFCKPCLRDLFQIERSERSERTKEFKDTQTVQATDKQVTGTQQTINLRLHAGVRLSA